MFRSTTPSSAPPIVARMTGHALLLALALTTLPSCGDSRAAEMRQAAEAAMHDLQLREAKLLAREQAASTYEVQLSQRERQLAAAATSLEQQKQQADALQAKLEEQLVLIQRQQDALLARQKRGPVPSVTAERVIVIDPGTNEILLEKNSDRKGQVASTQKLMTALIIASEGDLDKVVTVEKADCECAPVRFGLKPGDQYTRRELLTVLLVKSSNDIAQALARDNAGSLEAFAKKMNAQAAKLGMDHSFFVNPNGLPEDRQFSTARDMAKVAKAIDVIPDVRKMVKLKSFELKKHDGSTTVLDNTNRVLRSFQYCDGMKTGYTQAAGYCLISSGEMNGRRRIVVLLNGTPGNVWKESQALLEWSLRA